MHLFSSSAVSLFERIKLVKQKAGVIEWPMPIVLGNIANIAATKFVTLFYMQLVHSFSTNFMGNAINFVATKIWLLDFLLHYILCENVF